MPPQWPLVFGIPAHAFAAWAAYHVVQFIWSLDPGWGGAAAVIVIPLAIYDWLRFGKTWIQAYRSLPLAEQYLRHAGQGAATVILTILLARWLVPDWAVLRRQYTTDPYTFWAVATPMIIPLAVGVLRFLAGAAVCRWFVFMPMPSAIALLKMTAGIVIWRAVWPTALHTLTTNTEWERALWTILAAWLAITGGTRLVFVSGLAGIPQLVAAIRTARMRRKLEIEKVHGRSIFIVGDDLRDRIGK